MNGKKWTRIVAALTLCVSLLTACGGGQTAAERASTSNASGNAVTVNSTEALLEAIAPGASISIAPGYYNMSEYLEELWAREGYEWNQNHDYVQLNECYDGVEFIIRNADGMSITGGSQDVTDTELVVTPRYATVFKFQNCKNIKLSTLTLGHTDTGECVGSVVCLSACENVELRNMDLYGCGVIGLECDDGSGDVFVYDSALRDCSFGPLHIVAGVGKFEFYDCALTGSDGGGYYDGAGRSSVAFHRCVFGEQESNYWAFDDSVVTEDCTWAEITEYPDYGEYDPEDIELSLEPDAMSVSPFSSETYADSAWVGYRMEDATGEEAALPSEQSVSYVGMILRADGTGSLYNYYSAETPLPFLWELNADMGLSLWTKNNGTFSATLYQRNDADETTFPSVWMKLNLPEGVMWLY